MLKTVALVCATLTTCTASGFGIHKAGWFSGKTPDETPHVRSSDPFQSEAAIRYRTNQSVNWRMMMIR